MLQFAAVCARRSGAVAAAVVALALVAPVAVAGGGGKPQKGGSYTGTQQEGAAVSFTVSGDGKQVKNFTSTAEPACTGLSLTFRIHHMTIDSNRFSGSAHPAGKGSAARVTGRFQGRHKASGLVSWSSRRFIYCDSSRQYTAQTGG